MELDTPAGRIAALRRFLKKSRADFAADLGVKPQHVSGWERGTINLTIARLQEICATYGVEPNDLIPVPKEMEKMRA